ncbi:hypothetical protein [Gaoshiqia sp. Z1-71]|uniref:hypothetical protein n=1 Tax=Gaoshiqia hydrogeniformans TaxID=3290090 RepID=UPI003BF81A58
MEILNAGVMHFQYLNLKKSREHLLCDEKTIPPSPGRRKFMKALGLGALAWNPLVDSIKLLSKDAFEIKQRKQNLLFYRNNQLAWEISDRIFESGFSTSFRQQDDRYIIEASGLTCINTNLTLSVQAEIYFEQACWLMKFRIPELKLNTTLDLLHWLDGHVTIYTGTVLNKTLAQINNGDKVGVSGNLHLRLDHQWKLDFEGKQAVGFTYQSHLFQTGQLSIIPATNSEILFLNQSFKRGTRFRFTGFEAWGQLISHLDLSRNMQLSAVGTPTLELLLGEESLIWVSGRNDQLRLASAGFQEGELLFDKYFFFAEYLKDITPRVYFSASLPQRGQWLSNQLGAFKFAPSLKIPDFEAFGTGNQLYGEILEPRLHAFKAHLPGGTSLTSTYADSPSIRINLQEPVKRVTTPARQRLTVPATTTDTKTEEKKQEPASTPATTQPTGNITTVPQEPVRPQITNQPQLDIQVNKIRFRPKRALTVRVLRPEDMILLEFEFHNFNYTNRGQAPFLELDDAKKNGVVIVYFTSQHTLEEAFFESNQIPGTGTNTEVVLPAKHLRARRSRLVYELPAGHGGFPLTMNELLDWSKFKLRVNPRAWIKIPQISRLKTPVFLTGRTETVKTPSSSKYLDTQSKDYAIRMVESSKVKAGQRTVYQEDQLSKVLQPADMQTVRPAFNVEALKNVSLKVGPVPEFDTSIEAPTLMYISPNQTNDFFHQKELQFRDTTEMKLVSQDRQLMSTEFRVLDPLSTTKGQVTELWHTTLGVRLTGGKVSRSLGDFKTIRALWADEANEKYETAPPLGEPFMASLDASDRHILVHTTSNYSIPGYSPKAVPVKNLMLTSLGAYLDWHAFFDVPSPADDVLSIIEWEHFATLGRDHYVKVVREGYLFPFGHRAALVKVTERKFHQPTKSAVNRQRMYIVILEKEVLYSRTDPQGKFIEFPFQAVRVNTTKTPDIDNPADSTIINVPPAGGAIKILNFTNRFGGSANTSYNFYINVGNKGFPFDLVVTDKEGFEQQIRMPLAFLENRVARDINLMQQVINQYNPNKTYNEVSFAGQEIAYAESLVDGDTTLETELVAFGAQTYAASGVSDIKFHPKMQEAKVYLKQVDEMTGIRKLTGIGLEDDKNGGMVFARVAGAVLDFSGDSGKSGGFLSPNIEITALSKLQGPVGGAIDDMKDLNFLPDKFFKALDSFPAAKIFGVINIFDLLGGLDLGGAFDGLINTINSAKQQIEDFKNQILYLENLARETKENVESQIQDLQQQIKNKVTELLNALNGNLPKIPNLKTYVTNEAFYAEYKWQPEFKNSPIVIIEDVLQVNVADRNKALTITTKFEKPFDAAKPAKVNGSARFEKFGIDLVPLLAVNFNYLEFKTGSSQKTDVKVDIDKDKPIEFKGALSFVNNLQSIIPSGGFSDDGPFIELKPTQVTAGFNISIPNVEVGICMISNMSLGARVTLPFTGAPLTMGFNFCTRENPFLLTVSCFGGGGFFMMVTTLRGLQSIEAAFEFGAAMSLNVGVASGGVSAMGGFYFKFELVMQEVNGETEEIGMSTLTGYLRINGHLSILGLIKVSLEFYLAFTAVFKGDKVEKLEGIATLKVKVEVLFFSKTVSVTVRRELKGADADPKFIEMIDQDDWQEYCLAFAS